MWCHGLRGRQVLLQLRGRRIGGGHQLHHVHHPLHIEGYKIKKVLGVVTGLTPRTRGVLGKFVAGIESMFGGEVTAFTTELEKARIEAMERVKAKAIRMGANALVGLDLETSDMGYQMGIIVISATGTAVIVEPEN